MPYLQCTGCGDTRLEINIGSNRYWNVPNKHSFIGKLIGSATCRGCGAGTGFEIVDNVIAYVSGKSSYGELNAGLESDTKIFEKMHRKKEKLRIGTFILGAPRFSKE